MCIQVFQRLIIQRHLKVLLWTRIELFLKLEGNMSKNLHYLNYTVDLQILKQWHCSNYPQLNYICQQKPYKV